MILVSACLLGHKTKYNGGANPQALLIKYNECGKFVAVCPEYLGRLPIPHPPFEIVGGGGKSVLEGKCKIVGKDGQDVTQNFISGARKVLEIARQYGVKSAILKERSPSCGVRQIYDGTFSGVKRGGQGVCAALLSAHGIRVFSEEEITEQLLQELIG